MAGDTSRWDRLKQAWRDSPPANGGAELKHDWNAFPADGEIQDRGFVTAYGAAYTARPDRPRLRISNERSIIASIYMRMAVDISLADMHHVRLDENERYVEDIDSRLNNCLRLEANLDQTSEAFMIDLALTLFEEGYLAIVPVDTTLSPLVTGGYDIKTMRIGSIVQWYPQHVRVSVWNEKKGMRQEITLPKTLVAIIVNPFYSVMNEPNSTLQRLRRKLALLDAVDDQSSSGKLDMVIQLPYTVRTETKRATAEKRREDIEFQLKDSKYGIAYLDGSEKITQLNRPVENNLWQQIKDLTDMLYDQLGLTKGVMNGTAGEPEMLNYNNRTIAPILDAIKQGMLRRFLTKTARSQKQSIMYFRDPFKLVPLSQLAEIADKLTRNEILTSNEFRQILSYRPHNDPKADQLINSNLVASTTGVAIPGSTDAEPPDDGVDTSADTDLDAMGSSFDDEINQLVEGAS